MQTFYLFVFQPLELGGYLSAQKARALSADPSALCRRGRRKGPRSIALVAQSSVTEPALCLARAWFVHPWHFVDIQSMWGLPWFCFHLAGSKMLCGTCLRTNLATPWACILMGVWPFRQVAHECHHSGDVLGCVFTGFEGALSAPVCGRIWPPLGLLS